MTAAVQPQSPGPYVDPLIAPGSSLRSYLIAAFDHYRNREVTRSAIIRRIQKQHEDVPRRDITAAINAMIKAGTVVEWRNSRGWTCIQLADYAAELTGVLATARQAVPVLRDELESVRDYTEFIMGIDADFSVLPNRERKILLTDIEATSDALLTLVGHLSAITQNNVVSITAHQDHEEENMTTAAGRTAPGPVPDNNLTPRISPSRHPADPAPDADQPEHDPGESIQPAASEPAAAPDPAQLALIPVAPAAPPAGNPGQLKGTRMIGAGPILDDYPHITITKRFYRDETLMQRLADGEIEVAWGGNMGRTYAVTTITYDKSYRISSPTDPGNPFIVSPVSPIYWREVNPTAKPLPTPASIAADINRDTEIAALKARLDTFQAQLDKRRTRITELESENTSLQAELDTARQKRARAVQTARRRRIIPTMHAESAADVTPSEAQAQAG